MSPLAAEVAPGSSQPTFPAPKSGSWGPTHLDPLERTQPRTCCSQPLFSCIWSLVPGSSGKEVPEDPSSPTQTLGIHSCRGSESPPLHYLSFFRIRFRENCPPSLQRFPHSQPPVVTSPTTGVLRKVKRPLFVSFPPTHGWEGRKDMQLL